MSGIGKVAGLLFVTIVFSSLSETFASKGMKQVGETADGWKAGIVGAASNPYVWAGVGLMVLQMIVYLTVLSMQDLSFATAMMAFTYVIKGVLSKYYLGETVNLVRWIGTGIIVVGVIVVGVSNVVGSD